MANNEQLLAEIDLSGCPLGTVLDKTEPDQSIEEQYFKGWEMRWSRPQVEYAE